MIDFNNITHTTFKYNFHSHTQFCDGRDVMEHFVKQAISEGFIHYGFSPHGPICVESPCNMTKSSVYEYINEVTRLKERYGSQINLYASMEIDYVSDSYNPASEYFQDLPLDYRIGSVHFIPSQDGIYVDIDGKFDHFKDSMQKYFHNDIRYVIDTFYSHSINMIEAGGIDIVGHLDKIGQNSSYFQPGIENNSWYNDWVMKLLDIIATRNLTIEVNTKALAEHNRVFPNYRYFKRVKELGIPVVFNSDTHYTNLINAGRDEAKAVYDSITI